MPDSPPTSTDLLLPGPQPPLTHFGATLLRHVVVTGLRYTLYHLGLPLPDKAPIKFRQLRLELDGDALHDLLDGTPEGRAVAAALEDPAGCDADGVRQPTGAAYFHRQRLRWARRRDLPPIDPPAEASASALERRFREQLSACLSVLDDALLDEVLAVLQRRALRRRGASPVPTVGPAAAAWLAGGRAGERARLDRLGDADPFVASWAASVPQMAAPSTPPTRAAGRGRFRELYRQALDGWRLTLLALAARAHGQGVVEHPEDLFFLPFELLGELTVDHRPGWLDVAVLRNRAEYFGLVGAASTAERAAWAAAPLRPLP